MTSINPPKRVFKKRVAPADQPVASPAEPVWAERRRLVRDIPVPVARVSDTESSWAVFQSAIEPERPATP